MANLSLYLTPDKEILREKFVGKSLKDVDAPAAVLDLDKVNTNCQRMLEAVSRLGSGWRAHIKTHKVQFTYLACICSQHIVLLHSI